MTKNRLCYDPIHDYYKILGVPATATLDEINRAYRKRAKEVHPDLNREREAWAKEQFQWLNTAHDVLVDPALRRTYDDLRLYHVNPLGYSQSRPPDSTARPRAQSSTTGPNGMPPRQTSYYAEASRAAWSRRKRIRTISPGTLFFTSLIFVVVSWAALSGSRPSPRDSSVSAAGKSQLDSTLDFSALYAGDPTIQAKMTGLAETALETAAVQRLPSLTPSTGSILGCTDSNVKIMARGRRTQDGTLAAPIELYGSATGAGFSNYSVDYRDRSDTVDTYQLLYISRDPVDSSNLLVPRVSMRPLNFFSARHVVDVRLTVNYLDNRTSTCQIMLVIMP